MFFASNNGNGLNDAVFFAYIVSIFSYSDPTSPNEIHAPLYIPHPRKFSPLLFIQ